MKTWIRTLIATVRPVAEYWLSFAIAPIVELWRPTGRHRRSRGEPSTFDQIAAEWGRVVLVVDAMPKPDLTPVAPKLPTIGERARMSGAADTREFVRKEFDRIVGGVALAQLGTGSHRERRAAA